MKQVSGHDLRGHWVYDDPEDPDAGRVVHEVREEPVEALLQVRPQFVPDLMKRVAKFQKIAQRHGQSVEARFVERIMVDHPVFGRKRKQVREIWAVVIPPMVGVKGRVVGHFEQAEDRKSQYVHVFAEAERAACEALLPRAGECDHCRKQRARVKSFVVEHEGEVKLIGKSCLKDYLGIDPAWALAAAEWFEPKAPGEEDDGCFGSWRSKYVDLMEVVAASHKVARKHGGYPQGEDRYWFRNHVSILIFGGAGEAAQEIKAQYKDFDPGPLDLQALADYVEGAKDDFGRNLQIAFEQDVVQIKRMALIIAGVAMWVGRSMQRKDEEAKAAKAPPPQAFAEAVGKRIEFEAEVVRAIPRSGDFGMSLIIGLKCDDGRQAVIFHSGAMKPEAGKRYKVRASIKRHQPGFRGWGHESVLSRAIFKELPA